MNINLVKRNHIEPLPPEILPIRPQPTPVPEAVALISPLIYVQERAKWEYRQMVRDLATEPAPTEAELSKLGADGWELISTVTHAPLVYFYFKRLAA